MKLNTYALGLAIITVFASSCNPCIDPEAHMTPFEKSNGTETATYEEGIKWWQALAKASPFLKLIEIGSTDCQHPMHLVLYSPGKNFSLSTLNEKGYYKLLINNAIHPGEPDGVDASMLFLRDLLSQDDMIAKHDSLVIGIIPFYNVGGAINRGCCSRANQEGPNNYGFRGNARNLDLNRDFVKCDSRNAQTFSQLFTSFDPDVYLETHVSNGADYPYTMTYLASQSNKLGEILGTYVRDDMTPALFHSMEQAGDTMTPYVNVYGTSPDSGYTTYYDSPRYSTGYAALHQTIGLLTETHMLKPFQKRVESTKRFIQSLTRYMSQNGHIIRSNRNKEQEHVGLQKSWPIDWAIDKEVFTRIKFSGYRAYTDTSLVTGLPQLYYDRSKPWHKTIPYYEFMKPIETVNIPSSYLVPSAWSEVIDRLKWNGVEMELVSADTEIIATTYEITGFKSPGKPYEGHFLHTNTEVLTKSRSVELKANSYYLISLNQNKRRFLLEMLEPQARDSYFNWNFYDEILMQKEWFSSYVFDHKAQEILAQDSSLFMMFSEKKNSDSTFANSAQAQLYFIYRNSEYYERNRHNIYPVYRVE